MTCGADDGLDEMNSSEELAHAEQLPAESEEQYTGAVTQDPRTDETAVREAIRRQVENPEDHDSSLIEESPSSSSRSPTGATASQKGTWTPNSCSKR